MNPFKQIKNITPVLVMAYAATTVILSLVIFVGIENGIELDHFTQDPTTVMDAPFYLGFFSYVGILFWCAAAALCFFTRSMITGRSSKENSLRLFLLCSGLITCLFLLDDLFLLHEVVFPDYFHIPEIGVYLIYSNVIVFYMVYFRSQLLDSEFLILGLSYFMIAVSQFVDLIPMPIPEDSFLEDAVKLFGVVSWLTYYARYCRNVMRKLVSNNAG
jgi:hypothetical protein